MSVKRIYTIFDREHKKYFIGFDEDGVSLWESEIESALPYYEQNDADDDYEKLKQAGFDVEVN